MPPMPPPYQPTPSGPPPLSAPYYGASFGAALARFWRKYATFSGRASRSEYWWWYLAYFIFIAVVESILGFPVGSSSRVTLSGSAIPVPGVGYYVTDGIITAIELAVLVPSLAIVWRRLHDTDRSGRWIFISLIPLVGPIMLIVFLASGPKPAGVRFDRL